MDMRMMFCPYYIGLLGMGMFLNVFRDQMNVITSFNRQAIEKGEPNLEAAVEPVVDSGAALSAWQP